MPIAGTRPPIRDTRKTTPGMRRLEKYAVRCGGGVNHRMSLSDAALVKDNHVVAAGGVAEAFDGGARASSPASPVEVEVDSLDQLDEVLDAGADLVLLDNFTRRARCARPCGATHGRALLEASGGLTLDDGRGRRRHGRRLPCRRSPHPLRAGARHRRRPAPGVLVLLAIDVGNTNTVLGLFDGERSPRRGGSRPTPAPPPTRWC